MAVLAMGVRIAAVVVAAVFALAVEGKGLRAQVRSHHGAAAQHRGSSSGRAHHQGALQVLTHDQQRALATSSLAEVIQLLSQMVKEFMEAADDDRKNWDEYSAWSDQAEMEKNDFIQDQRALVMETEATLAANRQEVAKLTDDLADLAKDISETQKSLKELIAMRQEEHKQFEISLADVTKTIRAVTKATEILEGHYGADKASLAEIRARVQMALTVYATRTPSATPQNVHQLASLLQSHAGNEAPDFLNADGSKYETYEKQGGAGGVLGMLADLSSQLTTQKQDLITTENNAEREFQQTKAAKEASLKNMFKIQEEKTNKKAECEATIDQCIATIDQAKREIKEAQEYLKLLLEDRAKFLKMFNERTTMREQERAATQAALDALQSVSAGNSLSFLQVNSGVHITAKAGTRLRNTLTRLIDIGREIGAPALALIQSAVKLQQDYMGEDQATFYDQGKFGPVLKLLSDLIAKLEEEQNAETSQHEWCETEKTTSVTAQGVREKNLHDLKTKIDEGTTTIDKLKSEVLFLESEIKRVEKETKEAIAIRKTEHELFVTAKADHEEVIHAIGVALEALTGQYGFLQIDSRQAGQHRAHAQHGARARAHQAPGGDAPFAAYASGGAGAASAMEMLQDLQSKYSTALTELIENENAAQKAHEDLLERNAQFIEDCTNTKAAKTTERRGMITDMATDKAELKRNVIELNEVSKYLMDLRPSCDDIRSTYEERKKRREAEISALKEALEVISDPSTMSS